MNRHFLLNHVRLSFIQGSASLRSGVGCQENDVEILRAATWNLCGGNKSAQAPAAWVQADQRNELVKEVLRWGCDVVSLQEVEAETPLTRLLDCYSHVGSSASHRGFVHLYISKKLIFRSPSCSLKGAVVCELCLKTAGSDVEQSVTVAAVHLAHGSHDKYVRARAQTIQDIVQRSDQNGVLILGDTNSRDEEATHLCDINDLREARYVGASWGVKMNKYYDPPPEGDGLGIRLDRMFTSGSVWAETFVVGHRRSFFGGCEFFLSDHFPVIGFFECHRVFAESGNASIAMAGSRRARLVGLRDKRQREESMECVDLARHCSETKIFAVDAASEASRIAALAAYRVAVVERDRLACLRLQAAIGALSLWRGDIQVNSSRALSQVPLSGWDLDTCDAEIPSSLFLRGITSGLTDVVMPCLAQVILRLPHMYDWIILHGQHCRNCSDFVVLCVSAVWGGLCLADVWLICVSKDFIAVQIVLKALQFFRHSQMLFIGLKLYILVFD